MHELINRQIEWSKHTFGPGPRTEGLIKHIEKELEEIRQNPCSLEEWIDVIILSLDGAWRCGEHTAGEIMAALANKQRVNIHERQWPQNKSPNDPMEHVRNVSEVRKAGERIADGELRTRGLYEPGLG